MTKVGTAVNERVTVWLPAYALNTKFGALHLPRAPDVQKADKAVHHINHYPLNSTTAFPSTYPLESVIQL